MRLFIIFLLFLTSSCITEDENRGIAHVLYDNGLVGTSDSVRAYVVNPENPKVPNSGNIYLNDNESV